jgi:hypothetical protein
VAAPGTPSANPLPIPHKPVPTEPAPDTSKLPVGIANNNPLNMRDYGIAWQGNIGRDNRGLEVFGSAENGLRAAGNDMKNKWLKGIDTIRKIVSVWAPANGQAQDGTTYINPTETYIKRVSQLAGIGENVQLLSAAQYLAVAKAMILFENGQNPYTDDFIKKWFFVGMRHGAPLPVYFDMDSSYGN